MARNRDVQGCGGNYQAAFSRRQLMAWTAAGAAAFSLPNVLTVTPAFATADQVASEIKKLYGDKKMTEGKIKLDLPSIAENGLVVPLTFEVESPQTDKDFVKAVHIFSEGNPHPGVASFRFTSLSPKAAAAIRIRLAQTQNIVAVAEMSNGELFTAKKEVKVTIGGCGG